MKKTIYLSAIYISLFFVFSCGTKTNTDTSQYTHDAAGFGKIQDEVIREFGTDAYYHYISVEYSPATETKKENLLFKVEVTDNPDEKKLKLCSFNDPDYGVKWVHKDWMTFSIQGDASPADFMFQLKDKCNLGKVGELLQKSIEKVSKEKSKKFILEKASIYAPENLGWQEYYISIRLQAESDRYAHYRFEYNLDGDEVSAEDD
ncbi:MAG: hypothetical protein LBT27_02495 [Prevotellaceae bacterium]|jgi:hypothetical protein|nr:hypothetical protein [Prevotellaceae bacterium]